MEWFEDWFDSPYYHLLYGYRDEKEAEFFIGNIFRRFTVCPNQYLLDLACGKGRHGIYMAKLGGKVTGLDLSSNSIMEANQSIRLYHLEDKARFILGDMRDFHLDQKFDFVFNLFTSFGYFENKHDNQKVIQCVSDHQNKSGILLIDYLNSDLVYKNGEESYEKTVQGIHFSIRKYFEGERVVKSISVIDGKSEFRFEERVQLFDQHEIPEMLKESGYETISIWGGYDLHPFQKTSPRYIIAGKKK